MQKLTQAIHAESMSDNSNYQYDVFISYSSKDRPWVKELLRKLEEQKIKVCIDYRDFILGMPSIKNIEQAVINSHKTLLILTPNYLESGWTEFENILLQTLDPANQQLRLLPLLKQKCELPLRLRALTYLNFANPEDEAFEWQRLVNAFGKQQIQTSSASPSFFAYDEAWISQESLVNKLKMHILHLSDLHFGTLDQAQLWSNQLAQDLKNELDIVHLDALILSGDVANKSNADEYEAAQKFFDNFRQDFCLKPEQIIIVPGNHDINWQKSEEAYTLVRRRNYDGRTITVNGETNPDPNYAIDDGGNYVEKQDEDKYKERFLYFSDFYESIKGKPYPLEYEQQCIIDYLPDKNLLILGLNSAWQLDHHYKKRASINVNALSKALTEIRRNSDYNNCLKIAVWHHPLDSVGNDRITDQGFIEQLAVADFRLFLHGHIHKAETSLYRYDMSQNGRKLDRICAGTFGAPTRELVSGYPWQYNLLKFEGNQLTVETRRREQKNGAWKSDARWSQGAGKDPLPRYTIQLINSKK